MMEFLTTVKPKSTVAVQNCDPCTTNPPIDGGTCGDYGLTIVDGQGVIYSREDLGPSTLHVYWPRV